MLLIVLLMFSGVTVVSTKRSAQIFITAPNIFHLGVEETISVILYNTDKPVKVTVIAQDFPDKKRNLSAANGVFAREKPGMLKLKLNQRDFPLDTTDDDDMATNRYAYLIAKTNDSDVFIDKEVKVLVSFLDGVVLLQTDKPIYTPQQSGSLEYTKVKIRILPLGFDLKPAKQKKVTVVVKNPQEVVVQKWKDLSTETGIITKIFGLSEFALIGNWTVFAFHGHENTQNTSVTFEVKEYVLPKFSVSISGPKYVLPNTKVIGFSIEAKYTFGKPVDGTTLVKFSMVGKRIKAVSVKQSSSELKDGKTDVVVTTDEIKKVPGLPWFPVGRRLQVEVDVIEKTSGKKESAIDNGIFFVKSPFTIEHQATAEFFKPALPFLVKVDLLYPSKNPARRIPMSISVTGTTTSGQEIKIGKDATKRDNVNFEDRTNAEGRANFVIDTPGNVKSMKIRVETEKDDIPEEHNTFIEFDVHAYHSPSRTFLYVRAIRDKQHINCDVFVNKNASKITFMVIARGKILAQWIKVYVVGVISSFRFRILPEMSPSSRLVAFYFGQNGEVIVDSTLLEIDDGLPNKVVFHEDSSDGQKSKYPSTQYKIQLSATPGTRIGLLVVDQSVYLLRNRKKLNKKKVFNLLESLDLGCGVGAGRDSEDVFTRAGTVVLTNTDITSTGRSDFACPQSKPRKKRSNGEDLVKCCQLGYMPSRASCVIRVRYWMAGVSEKCRQEFRRCCFNYTGETDPSTTQVRSRKVQQFELAFDDEAVSEGQVRQYFPETWIFEEDTVGNDGKFHFLATLPDTITTWVIQAVGVSNLTGLGVARPLYVKTFKEVFVSLRLPYSVQRGEQISVIATVFNYAEFNLKVKVKLEESKDFCTYVPAGQKSAVMLLTLKSHDATSVSFPIIPIKLGKVSVKVSVTAEHPDVSLQAQFGTVVASDVVLRNILVVPEGVERRIKHSFVLDPTGVLRDEKPDTKNSSAPAKGIKHHQVVHNDMQTDRMLLRVPSRAIPGSVKASLSLTGNLIGPAVTSLISGGLETLLRMPMGCGEQTMMFLAPNVYVLQYLSQTRQVTAEIESRAYTMIQSGYQRALNYRRADKSFSAFGESRPGSTWLTAFAARVFCAAQNEFDGIAIDENLVCDSVSWMLENQRQDGAFPEMKDIIHKSMMGGTHGDVAMTAFVIVSLLECRCHGQNKSRHIQDAVAFMETELDRIHKVNILALSTYALALAGSSKSSTANKKLLQSMIFNKDEAVRYWDVGNDALNVETTAYALLAQMALGRLTFSGPIVTWLTGQRDPQGGFVSTQDTCVALQALSKYSEKTAGAKLDLRVSVSSEKDVNWKRKYHIDRGNALILRQEDVTPLLGGQLFIDSSGSGVGQLLIEVHYNVPSAKNETCHFALKIEVREEAKQGKEEVMSIMGRSRGRRDNANRRKKSKKCRKNKKRKSCKTKRKNVKHHKRPSTDAKVPDALQLKICARYLKQGKTGMTIMEIGVFSGFSPDKESLIELMENVRPTVDRFEVSDRSVILYVSEISSDREFCAKFMVNRINDVGTVQPVPVKVYDYYKPDDSCTEFYSPNARSALLAGMCQDGYCKCSQDDCSSCVGGRSFTLPELASKVCSDFDFAFIGEVLLLDERHFRKQSWITYDIAIKEVIKKKKTDLKKGDFVEFKKRSGCQCPELVERKEYLIMGQEKGQFFLFDEGSFVIPWVRKRTSRFDLRARVGLDPRCNI